MPEEQEQVVEAMGQPLHRALAREWLVSDGLGGYASGTIVGPYTRRYHGLLVAPLAPPLGRHVLLNKLEETLTLAGQAYPLSASEFEGGQISPPGYQYLAEFRLDDGLPVWRFRAGAAQVEKRVWMEPGQSTTYVSYTVTGLPAGATAWLSLVPLCSFREFHHETVGSDDWRFAVERIEGGLSVHAYAGATPYSILVQPPPGKEWTYGGRQGWWWHFLHREERERGQDFLDDCYAAGEIGCALDDGETLLVAATVEAPDVARERLRALSSSQSMAGPLPLTPSSLVGEGTEPSQDAAVDPFVVQLRRAAHQFLVARAMPGEAAPVGAGGALEARTVLAGYHWFGDWGRDTFIALPGLALATGRHHECREIVRAFARYVDKGMLPNRFPDTGAPLNDGDYNTVDATLWYFHAVHVMDRLTGGGLAAELFPVLAEIVEWHVQGTRFGIHVDPKDGLLRVENPQLTWMDAKVGDWVCTPRDGKPVEIAALWHHALSLMEVWARQLNRKPVELRRYSTLRVQAAESFSERFWNAERGCLYDTIDGSRGNDGSVRPNQVIAAALPDCPLAPGERKAVVDKAVEHLWTPRGLRTLTADDPAYHGRYIGDVRSRDGAYHQGTVWPWPLGSLVDAHLLVYRDKAAARKLVEPLREHLLEEACVGSINEIFDGDAPHTPRGCVAQAWSVAEVYRAWMATAE